VVHLVFPLLASSVACIGSLSHCLAGSLAVSHSGSRSGRRFGAFERTFFSACATAARTASDLTDNLPVCTKVTSPRPSKKHRFWLLNRSFLNSLRMFVGPPLLWKPCGNSFLQKDYATNWAIKKFTPRAGSVSIMLNIRGLIGHQPPARVTYAGWLLRNRFQTFAQVCSRESTDKYSRIPGATHFTC
jgi:hypothetical protein